ncbi:MAG: hypothetical protein LBT14_04880 [Treponema sp.]|nr:hypothetical protein [Treponema sp.]
MKFTSLLKLRLTSVFMLFNIIIFCFLLVVCTVSFYALGIEFAFTFWRSSWPLVLVMMVVLIGLDTFWVMNYQLFLLLEREDWPALARYLEKRILEDGHYSFRLVRLLANTYLVLSDALSVINLENKTASAKPALLESNALIFGPARILGKDIPGAVQFFSARFDFVKSKSPGREFAKGDASWIRWYYGFSLFLDRQFSIAADQFMLLARGSADVLVTGLSAFYLADALYKVMFERKADLRDAASEGRDRVRKSLQSISAWNEDALKIQAAIHGVIIARALQDAGGWIYRESDQG